METNNVINSVKYWLENTIIEYNFCPFAKREFVNNSINYETPKASGLEERLTCLEQQFIKLDNDKAIETVLIIFSDGLESFLDYLGFLNIANELLFQSGYEGIYQLASFHPDYCFEGVKQDDASNYTNRSPYPIIHILREDSLELALENYEFPENIPTRNIEFAKQKGQAFFQNLLDLSLKNP